ncbi:MAG TPA: hypothetical protein DD638_10230 [Pasteurellaceae bacterium]|nr:hypothetical protein [Pasteurellaceae bacterium]
MNKIAKFLIATMAAIALAACDNHSTTKKVQEEPAAVKKVSNWQGTYEGIMPIANDPETPAYTLLALSQNGEYEMFQKQIERIGTYASKGKFHWDASQNSLTLTANENIQLQLSENSLKNKEGILNRISNEENINEAYFSYLVKHNQSGENYTIKIYSEGESEYAEFEFKEKKYKLKVDLDNSQEQVFRDGDVYLAWNIIDPAPIANYNPTFYDGKETHTFTMLSPTNVIYQAEKDDAPVKTFDVLYFNHERGKSFVKLMSSNILYQYTLNQTEASAKTASYESDAVKWHLDNNRKATFIINNIEHQYAEETLK